MIVRADSVSSADPDEGATGTDRDDDLVFLRSTATETLADLLTKGDLQVILGDLGTLTGLLLFLRFGLCFC